jgi:hypothetical protein
MNEELLKERLELLLQKAKKARKKASETLAEVIEFHQEVKKAVSETTSPKLKGVTK